MNKDKYKQLHDNLIFVGYTNGYQIKYALDPKDGGEGAFYSDTENECYIPLYMLKTHWHRLESTTGGNVTIKDIRELQKALRSDRIAKS